MLWRLGTSVNAPAFRASRRRFRTQGLSAVVYDFSAIVGSKLHFSHYNKSR